MKTLRQIVLSSLLLLFLAPDGWGQKFMTMQRRAPEDCSTCHVSWHSTGKGVETLIPRVNTNIIIDGKPSMVTSEAMCLSCHDGYVADSREVFLSKNHHGNMKPGDVKVKDLPLNSEGEIYCGTCHSVHSLPPERPDSFAPFMRVETKNSQLCMKCHEGQTKSNVNHPIHVAQATANRMPPDTRWGDGNKVECMTCHPIHENQKVQLVEGKNRTALCSACHADQFEISLTDHDLTVSHPYEKTVNGLTFQEQDICASCHVTHEGEGKFMWALDIKDTKSLNAYCLECHSTTGLAKAKAFKHEGHLINGKKFEKAIPELAITAGEELKCVSCHDPHRWEHQGKRNLTAANEEGTAVSSFLRLPDDANGSLCTTCHSEKQTVVNSDHSIQRGGFKTYFANAGNSQQQQSQCSVCHATHKAGFAVSAGKGSPDKIADVCQGCHNDALSPTTVGHADHPMDIPFDSKSKLPGRLVGKQTLLSCNTCHDPHDWGTVKSSSSTADMQGDDENSFLRVSNFPEPGLCFDCHSEQKTILMTDHDLSEPGKSACSMCHTPHNASAQAGILARWEDDAPGATYNEKHCFTCHKSDGIAAGNIPIAFQHPHQYGTVTTMVRNIGSWTDFPLFTATGPAETFGYIDCFTCHNPHKWSFDERLQVPKTENDEGTRLTSFLREPSEKTLCSDCHGESALWKYNYYHDPLKRKRY